MKILKFLPGIMCAFVIVTGFSACKKDKDKKPDCRISAFTVAGQAYNVLYNGNGKLISVVSSSFSQTYDYSGNTTVVTSLNAGAFSSKVIITNNAAGLAINVRTESNSSGTEWTNEAYEYNGDELAKQTSTRSGDTSRGIITYTWFNHNMIVQRTASTVTVWDYDASAPRQKGDYLDFFQFLSGYEYLRTRNIIKSIGNSTLTYGFDIEGNISSVSVGSTGGTPASINYQYECN
jgi:hypothetical protein